MFKTILKELIIILLLIAAIALILTVLFYDSVPMNKVVPTKVTYTLPENLQTELDKTLEEEQEIIVTYKVEEKDLNVYEKNNSYNPGKKDPFSVETTNSNPTTNVGGKNDQTGNNGNSSNQNKPNGGGSTINK